jgi:hypothetical protein
MKTWHRIVALLAPLLATLAIVGFGSALTGFSHADHPVALLGAHAVPMAKAFNLLAYVAPGLLLAALAWSWRGMVTVQATGFAGRLGLQLLVLAALAYAAQGLLPLEPRDLDAPASRLHAAAWMLWWIAVVAAAAALAWNAARSRAGGAAMLHLAIAATILFLVLEAGAGGDAPIAQRAAVAAWFAWVLVLALAGPLPVRRA